MEFQTPITGFSLFRALPTELRLKIWKFAAREPRLVQIKYNKDSYQHNSGRRFYAKSFISPTPVPAVLHACQESRSETLSEFQLSFATPYTSPHVYVAMPRDTVRFSSFALAYLETAELRSISSMSLEVMDFPYFAHFNMRILRSMERLAYLELIAIEGENALSLRILRTLMEDFDEEMDRFLEGKLPSIRIVSEDSGEELAATTGDGNWTGGFALHMETQAPSAPQGKRRSFLY